MILFFCITLLLVMFLLPFVPAYYEFVRKRDAAPLSIKMDYVKDPHFFSQSFKQKFNESLTDANRTAGLHDMKISKQEMVEIVENAAIADDVRVSSVYYVKDTLNTGNRVAFAKELYVHGNANFGENNEVRALACNGDIFLGRGTKIVRWIDAVGSVKADDSCRLGVSVSCRNALMIAPDCSFSRLYGFPVIVGSVANGALVNPTKTEVAESALYEDAPPERDFSNFPPHSRVENSIITNDSLTVGDSSVIYGHIKTYGNLALGENVVVTGNLFAEGTVRLGAGSRILGTVFTQDRVYVGRGVVIGTPGKIKSVVGKKGISLESAAAVYGYVMTEGKGIVI